MSAVRDGEIIALFLILFVWARSGDDECLDAVNIALVAEIVAEI